MMLDLVELFVRWFSHTDRKFDKALTAIGRDNFSIEMRCYLNSKICFATGSWATYNDELFQIN